MGVYKRGNTYWFSFKSPRGQRIRCSAGTKDEKLAQQAYIKAQSDSYAQAKLGEKPSHTWKSAVIRWVKEQTGKASLKNNLSILNWLRPYLDDKTLNEITDDFIETIAVDKENEGVQGSTVNKTLGLIRNIMNRSEKGWKWIDKCPHIQMRPEPLGRDRWLTKDEAERLLRNLPDHLREATIFTLAVGLRHSNVLKMKWSVIDMERRHAYVRAINSKSRKPIPVPLNTIAMDILQSKLNSINRHPIYVFTYKGKPVGRASTAAWRKALKRAGIEDFKWHDLRHTWASWHVQNGTTLHELQLMGGWAKSDMVQRYAHLSSDHLQAASGNIENIGTNLSHIKSDERVKRS